MKQIKKILIARFSSIGDIVLTTPVIRCANQQLPGTEIHYVTKATFKEVIENNPYLHKIHTFKADISELFEQLKAENYDLVVDLHHNLRSYRLKKQLKTKSYSFNKLNIQKFFAVNFKMLGSLPEKHIVDRYFETVAPIGITNDAKGLDYFLKDDDLVNMDSLFQGHKKPFIALVVGGSYYTKKIPIHKLREICEQSKMPVVLLGGKEDLGTANKLMQEVPGMINACGSLSVNQSASVVQQAEWVITSDTGMMHIAASFNKKIISLWGNTIPEFGMAPYIPHPESMILEIKGLECRPCSKLGYDQCPLGHFKCMNDIDVTGVMFRVSGT